VKEQINVAKKYSIAPGEMSNTDLCKLRKSRASALHKTSMTAISEKKSEEEKVTVKKIDVMETAKLITSEVVEKISNANMV